MKIAVEGCAHGELEQIYAAIKEAEQRDSTKIDLLICCGDFQSARNNEDLACMAVPPKYRRICSFYKYFSGELQAPILTIFIGGNHEASNYLQELPYGGWVAPNIYYMGYAGVINIAGLRIGGLSGIYKSHDYMKGRFERVPYDEQTKRSVYHVRNLDVFRLKQLTTDLDIFLSHDWPNGVYNFGNKDELIKKKPFFRDEISANQLGSKPCEELLNHLQPSYWFSAHLHVKFPALIEHESGKKTRFLALDKCLPRRQFLQILDIPTESGSNPLVQYDLEWLAILYLTDHLISVKSTTNFMPGPGGDERYQFTPSDSDLNLVKQNLQDNLTPPNFTATALSYPHNTSFSTEVRINPQTKSLCEKLHITDPLTLINGVRILDVSVEKNGDNVTFLDDSEDEEQEERREITPLKLPMPKSSEDINPEEGVALKVECLEVGVSTEENNVSPKRDFQEEGEVIKEDAGMKKFKRRNASMYSSDCL